MDYLDEQLEKGSDEAPFSPCDKDMLHLRLDMVILKAISFYEAEDNSMERFSRLSQQ